MKKRLKASAWSRPVAGVVFAAAVSALCVAIVANASGCGGSSGGGLSPEGGAGSSSGGSGGSSGSVSGSSSGGGMSSSSSGGVSGSSSGGASCSPGTTACEQCTSQSCCSQETACSNDPACGILLRCLLLCGSDETCINACGDSVGNTALSELVATLDCSTDSCKSACSGDAGTCAATPTLHPDTPGSIYCFEGADGGEMICSGGKECCLGGATGPGTYAPQFCEAIGDTCDNGGSVDAGGSPGVPIDCFQVSDCTANGSSGAVACCLQNATAPAYPAGCTYPRATLGSGVVCETSACAAGETTMCESQADCPSGKTCTAGRWKVFQVGFCL